MMQGFYYRSTVIPVVQLRRILFGLKILSVLLRLKNSTPRIDASESETAKIQTAMGYYSAHREWAWRIPPVNHIRGKQIRGAITKSECELARAG